MKVIIQMKTLVRFRLSGRFAHFLKAEAGVSALSYPVPTRTAIMGIIGAIMGLDKDSPQVLLEPADIALAGRLPAVHWHTAKLRKDPPEGLPFQIKKTAAGNKKTKDEKATLIKQEWLFNPQYTVWVSLPKQYSQKFAERLKERRWYFQPCLGISEMSANVEYLETVKAEKLARGIYPVESVIRQSQVKEIDTARIYADGIALHLLRMPRTVTKDRVFSHETYILEKNNSPVSVETDSAYQVGEKVLMFL